jgi:hypothetical protein
MWLRDALEEISQDLGAARIAADLGDAAAVGQFVARVHEVMRTENGTWVGAGDAPDLAKIAIRGGPGSWPVP